LSDGASSHADGRTGGTTHRDAGGSGGKHDSGAGGGGRDTGTSPDTGSTTSPDSGRAGDSAAPTGFLLGWYEGASCNCSSNFGGPGNIDNAAAWLGKPITIGSDYAAVGPIDAGAASWENWEFPAWQSQGWQMWRQAHPTYKLVYAPGMGVAEDIPGGSNGDYDMYWTKLAESLIAAGYPDAIIRIAHEFNGNWYWYQPQGQTTQFIGYWQHIVNAMRSATGQAFKFFWNPNLGVSDENGVAFDCEDAYPGDAYVDYIGPDTYDADWGVYPTSGTITVAQQQQAWQNTLTEDHGLNWFVTFAGMHNKPLAIAEWGLWQEGSTYGGGDDPTYIKNMHAWLIANHVAFADYFDSGGDAIYPDAGVPMAAAEFLTAFQ
jgi:hypothetical protein